MEIGPVAGSCGTAAFYNKQIIVSDIETDPLWENFQVAIEHGLRACWSTPIRSSSGKVLGTFANYYRQPKSPSHEQLQIIDRIAQILGVLIDRKLAEEEILRYRNHLEDLIKERTAELENAQQELIRNERLAVLGQLTGTVGHELRNPLGAMRPSLFVLRKRTKLLEDIKLEQAIERVERNITRCDHIIDKLLDFARITDLELEATGFDEWLTQLMDEQPVPNGLTVVRNFGLAGTELQIDIYRLRRAIINVYENACQATDEDASDTQTNDNFLITIDIIKTNHRFEISITDNGPGIASDVLPKIFEPLYSTKSFGLGLGLPTVKQIMKQHGGNIEIETSPGQGTKMILWLPLSLAKEAAA